MRMDMKALQRSTERLQIIGTQFSPARLRRHLKRQMPVHRTACTHPCGQIDRQRADDGVARLHLRGIEVRHMPVKGRAVLVHPVQGAGVAADEPSGHEVRKLMRMAKTAQSARTVRPALKKARKKSSKKAFRMDFIVGRLRSKSANVAHAGHCK